MGDKEDTQKSRVARWVFREETITALFAVSLGAGPASLASPDGPWRVVVPGAEVQARGRIATCLVPLCITSPGKERYVVDGSAAYQEGRLQRSELVQRHATPRETSSRHVVELKVRRVR